MNHLPGSGINQMSSSIFFENNNNKILFAAVVLDINDMGRVV